MKLFVEVASCFLVHVRCGAGGLSQACQLAETCNYSKFTRQFVTNLDSETTFGDTYRACLEPTPLY